MADGVMMGAQISRKSEGRRARMKRKNRQAILHAAEKVFRERNYQMVAVRDVIRETDLAYGTFYNYFESIEDLINEVANGEHHLFRSELDALTSTAETPCQRVEAGLRAYFTHYVKQMQANNLSSFETNSPGMNRILSFLRCYWEECIGELTQDEEARHDFLDAAIGLAKEWTGSGRIGNLEQAKFAAVRARDLLFGAAFEPHGVIAHQNKPYGKSRNQ